jgi:transposase
MRWVGLDVHARSTHAAALDRESGALTRARFGVGSEEVVAWLRGLPQPVHACYEAGPTGFALYRAAEAAGVRVDVVAPSKTPRAPGDRVKTDRKDAELLVRLLLAGSLTPVWSQARRSRRPAISHGLASRRGPIWHASVTASRNYSFGMDGCSSAAAAPARSNTGAGLAPSASRTYRPSSLSSTTWPRSTGWSLAARRSTSGSRASPSTTSSGRPSPGCAASGGITKTGSGYARRLLVEAAWHYTREPRISVSLRGRHEGQPEQVVQIAWRAQHRLYRLHHRLRRRGKPGNVAVVAAARELTCFLWAATMAWPQSVSALAREAPEPKLPARATDLWATTPGHARS